MVARTALRTGISVRYRPYLFETSADESWRLSRSPTASEAAIFHGYRLGASDLEEVLGGKARDGRYGSFNPRYKRMTNDDAQRFGDSKVARVTPSNLDHERVDWTPLAVRATCVMGIALEHCPMPSTACCDCRDPYSVNHVGIALAKRSSRMLGWVRSLYSFRLLTAA